MENNSSPANTAPFVEVKDVKIILQILESRLPRSAHVYNMAIQHPKYHPQVKFYTLDGDLTMNAWVIVTYDREDYGKEANISAPLEFESEVLARVKDAFANSGLIDWRKPYSFPEIDRSVSPMLFEISVYIKGNVTEFTPCYLYYFDREEARRLNTRVDDPDVEIRPLGKDLKVGAQFMYDTCLHKTDGSMEYIENLITRSPTVGVFKNGQLISGAITTGNGLVGFLYTLPEFRNKNYGKLSMQSLMREQAEKGFVPCSCAEMRNAVSNEFHRKIGMKLSHVVDYLVSEGTDALNK
jgi:GNAT superfamily N-acetyltransferase